MSAKVDQKRYRQLSEPFASPEAANKAIEAFFEELGELRVKHRLPDIYCIIAGNVLYPDGNEGEVYTTVSYGDTTKREPMAAWGLGHESARRQELITRIVADEAKSSIKGGRSK